MRSSVKSLDKDRRIFGAFIDKTTDYAQLVKLKLNLTVVFSAVMAYLIAASQPSLVGIIILAMGGFLVTGAANALNQILEREYDCLMKRTCQRPLADGRMGISEALIMAGVMSLAGTFFLSMFNAWAGLLGMISMVLYAFVYTPMKRVSPLAVTIGAVPGALPVMIGCVAVQGQITSLALLLFALQFFWQFPHFWAIAWLGDEDYKKAGFNLLPGKEGKLDSTVGMQAMIYALSLLPVALGFWWLGLSGVVAVGIIIIASAFYAFLSWQLAQQCNRQAALRVMFYSFLYLPLVLFTLYFDGVIG